MVGVRAPRLHGLPLPTPLALQQQPMNRLLPQTYHQPLAKLYRTAPSSGRPSQPPPPHAQRGPPAPRRRPGDSHPHPRLSARSAPHPTTTNPSTTGVPLWLFATVVSLLLGFKVGQVSAWGPWSSSSHNYNNRDDHDPDPDSPAVFIIGNKDYHRERELEHGHGQQQQEERRHKWRDGLRKGRDRTGGKEGKDKDKDKGRGHSFIADAVEGAAGSVVNICVVTETSSMLSKESLATSGSGFFIDEDGSILTNAHVVCDMSDGSKLTVTATDGTEYDGYIHSMDTMSDLAVVKIRPRPGDVPRKWPVLKLSTNINLRLGDWVIAIGSPFGLQNTVTAGVVSSIRRAKDEIGAASSDVRVEYIQTDCVIHEGSSGGPLVNLDGEVVGINTTRAAGEGISFAIRADNALDLIHQLHNEGRIVRPWLGCRMVTLTRDIQTQLREENQWAYLPPATSGVIITAMVPDSPSSRGGLAEGDVITAVNGKPVHSSQEVYKHMGLKIHEPVTFRVARSVPLDIDWDGRSQRWEVQQLDLVVRPDEFDESVHVDESGRG
ncbi:trypsin-like cysteine/serine peptidase domain-containing protein [Fimicolochytrium jonesii]|uniref:trypsin-like cysteine/serine peptidase domain-containing protein n=1 Tax=Fimicolochytrium jonesii TaxID=1396493 RepID=UPI0022FECD97|nr:trypsin-like cysteine/serine peptidase domain-containing protein [Fimicolochytrium jonesii]KAI8818499.1 trypsin-like cysteine/serine peptidase domain-containing protein [Fimicolochytrium jonesii]